MFALIFVQFILLASAAHRNYNNACKTLKDYSQMYTSQNCYHNPDVLSDTPTMITRHGYPLEIHNLTTSDGYVLNFFRIPGRNNSQPVFLMHGLACNSGIWTYTGSRSLAFIMADAGYDVWLGTIRGDRHGRNHLTLKVKDNQFWDFNIDHIATIDIREVLLYISSESWTNSSIIYVGHSLGTTGVFMYASEYPEEAQNLLAAIFALAPIFYLENDQTMAYLLQMSAQLSESSSSNNIFSSEHFSSYFVHLCELSVRICLGIVQKIMGTYTDQVPPEEYLVGFSYFPDGVSFQVVQHYRQISDSGVVRKFDYGSVRNQELYNTSEPEVYDLGNILEIPVYLFYGSADTFVTQVALHKLYDELGTSKKFMFKAPIGTEEFEFNHSDVVSAKDVKPFLFDRILKIFEDLFKD